MASSRDARCRFRTSDILLVRRSNMLVIAMNLGESFKLVRRSVRITA